MAGPRIRFQVLGSGSRGNATVVEVGDSRLLVDAGFSSRWLDTRLLKVGIDPSSIDAMLLSHGHTDHVKGAVTFANRHDVRVLGTRETLEAAERAPNYRRPPESPRQIERPCRIAPGESVQLGPTSITSERVSHDCPGALAFRLETSAGALAIATDLGHPTPRVLDLLADCRSIILEANHCSILLAEGPYPPHLKRRIASNRGHLSNRQTFEMLAGLIHPGLEHVVLAHLSETNNTPGIVAELAGALRNKMAGPVPEFHVATQNGETGWLEFGDRCGPEKEGQLEFGF